MAIHSFFNLVSNLSLPSSSYWIPYAADVVKCYINGVFDSIKNLETKYEVEAIIEVYTTSKTEVKARKCVQYLFLRESIDTAYCDQRA